MSTTTPGPRKCRLFNCDRKHGNFCCEDCEDKQSGKCKNPCLNGPLRCGQAYNGKRRNRKDVYHT